MDHRLYQPKSKFSSRATHDDLVAGSYLNFCRYYYAISNAHCYFYTEAGGYRYSYIVPNAYSTTHSDSNLITNSYTGN